jgi:PIN domain nuclease of toxin-antitoxin system
MDTSAILTLTGNEPGADEVEPYVPQRGRAATES